MASIPVTQKFHTVAADVDTENKGSALANADRESYTMQDILDTVSTGGGVDGSGTAGKISLFSDANTIGDSSIEEGGGDIQVLQKSFLVTPPASGVNRVGISDGSRFARLTVGGVQDFQAPTNATDAGTRGDILFTANYIYFCVNTDTWKRVALATW